MAEMTVLDEKLAEVLGLAQAAQQATKRVVALARREKEQALVEVLQKMGDEARRVEDRCQKAAAGRPGVKGAIAKEARETKSELVDFMRGYLEDADALDGLEFLSMAEAGELAHWQILAKLGERARQREITALVRFALPIQERHVANVADASLRLAAGEDPLAAA